MRCCWCRRDGAGLRYVDGAAALWFHPMCWRVARMISDRFAAKVSAADVEIEAKAMIECGADVVGGQAFHVPTNE